MKNANPPVIKSPVEQGAGGVLVPLLLVLTLFGIFSAMQSYFVLSVETPYLHDLPGTLMTELPYYWYFAVLAYIVILLSKRYPLKKARFYRWISLHVSALAVSFLIHQTLYILINKSVWGDKYEGTFLFLLFNNPSFWIELLAYTVFLLGISLIGYQRAFRENELTSLRLETNIVNARLHQIRSRIHPQFLFNSLSFLMQLLHTRRNNEANLILSLLSDFLRTTVYESDREEVLLQDEIQFLDLYLNIETLRLSPKFSVEKNIDWTLLSVAVPSFILQPIVEEMVYTHPAHEAVEHHITIGGRRNRNGIEMTVEEKTNAEAENVKGRICTGEVISMVRERLKRFYGESSSLICGATADGCVKVTLNFPLFPSAGRKENFSGG